MEEQEPKLKSLDLRITRQRKVILDEFNKANTHLTADEVYNRVRQRLPRVSLGTIYRNLEILADHGFIDKIVLGGHQKMFDGNLRKHYHMRCIDCDKLVDIPAENVMIDTSKAEKAGHFKVEEHRLELVGTCPGCDGNNNNNDKKTSSH